MNRRAVAHRLGLGDGGCGVAVEPVDHRSDLLGQVEEMTDSRMSCGCVTGCQDAGSGLRTLTR